MFISAAVEGLVDEGVIRRLVRHVGGEIHRVYGRNGKAHLRQRIHGYNQAARISPWIVLVDLNRDADCPPPLVAEWVPDPSPHMCFRVAVREVESWLLADGEAIARFLRVPVKRVPHAPELIDDPKRLLVELAEHSRRREIREDMVPRPGSGRTTGPAYASRLIEFAEGYWRPRVAAKSSDSLRRCLQRLRQMVRHRPLAEKRSWT